MNEVTLTPYEYAMASEVGRMRMLSAIRRGSAHKYGMTAQGWTEHIEGAAAELAVAKHLGMYWGGSVDTFKNEADLGESIEVRWRSKREWDLIVRPDDHDESLFVLVVGSCPVYTVVGAILGSEAKQEVWMQRHGGRPAAFFVPQKELSSLDAVGYRSHI